MRYILTFVLSLLITLGNSQTPINWNHTNGPEGSTGFQVVASNQYIYYSDLSFLHRSSDGMVWESFPMNEHSIKSVLGDSLILKSYVGSHQYEFSVNSGESWQEFDVPMEGATPFIGLTDSVLIYGVSGKIFRSTDLGQTWSELSNLPVLHFSDLLIQAEGALLVSDGKIFRSDVSGNDWTEIGPASPEGNFLNIKRWGQVIIAHTSNRRYYSQDGGSTWGFVVHINQGAFLTDVFWFDGVLYHKTLNASSTDFGETWNKIDVENYEGLNFPFLNLASFKNQLYGINLTKGLFKLDGIFKPVPGLNYSSVSDLEESDGFLFAATPTYVFKYDLASETWENVGLPLTKSFYSSVKAGGSGLITVSEYGVDGFFVSTNNGLTWGHVGASSFLNVRAVIDDVIFASDIFGDTGLLRSDNGGQSWDAVDALFDVEKIIKHKDFYLATIFPATILKSIDKGLTWVELYEMPSNFSAIDIASENGRLFTHYREQVAGHDKFSALYCSDNDGQDWFYCGDGLAQPPWAEAGWGISEFFYGEGVYYVAIRGVGLYGSTDDCKTWLPISFKHFYELAENTFFVSSPSFGGVSKFHPIISQSGIVHGVVFWDEDGNGAFDITEQGVDFAKVGVYDVSQNFSYFTYTDSDGSYFLGANIGADTLRATLGVKYIDTIIPDFYITDTLSNDKYFAVSLTPDITDLSIYGSYLTAIRPGFENSLILSYKNVGTISTDGTVSVKLDNDFAFVNATPTPSQLLGDSLIWSVEDLDLFEGGQIKVEIKVSSSAVLGDLVSTNVHISPAVWDDFDPQNNHQEVIGEIVGSFDPNDKSVFPEEGLTASEIEEGKEVFYTIRFQNTGTYLAEKVRITDVIDDYLDVNTIRLVGATHEITTFRLNSGRVLEIIFDQINLMDSTANEKESHGSITFAIKRKKLNSYNGYIKNMASIFFDFNEPIFTNTVSFGLKELVGSDDEFLDNVRSLQLHVYPNPSIDQCTIEMPLISSESVLSITDVNGNVWVEKDLPSNLQQFKINTSLLAEGIYFLELITNKNVFVGKIVVQF